MLSGGIDIIAIKYPDETYKSSPFRIRFGSFKVFKAKEKIINIFVNGQKTDLTMRLSESGEAYFQQEIAKINYDQSSWSDGYCSPVDLGQSAPTSPFKTPVTSDQSFNINLKGIECDKTYDDSSEEISMKPNYRKMSYDVLCYDNSDKNKMCRVENFTLGTNTQNVRIELSNCWSQLSKGKENPEEVFKKNMIDKDEFMKEPNKYLSNNNLAIRYGENIYTWKVIAPILVANAAFSYELPKEVIDNLAQEQQGYFLWKKINPNAFKIDLKRNECISPPIKRLDSFKRNIQYKKSYIMPSDQIKSLNLNNGKNEISFVVQSRYQGTQTITTDIYLWNHDDKIVISDLDGTITRSDVLGHIFPIFGKDWSHRGVVKLYNDVVNNGYKILYLTARAIVQADQTKYYLREKLIQSKSF